MNSSRPVHGSRRVSRQLDAARKHFAAQAVEAHVVGGHVRDELLGRVPGDSDIAVEADAIAHARAIAAATGGALVVLDEARDVARVIWRNAEARSLQPESTSLDIVRLTGGDLRADLRTRDFTINALAVPLAATAGGIRRRDVIDVVGGLPDLDAGVIRSTGPDVFRCDPLRTLRAVRFRAELGLRIDSGTEAAIVAAAPASGGLGVAAERVAAEVVRMLASPRPEGAVRDLKRLGLLESALPCVAACIGLPSGGAPGRFPADAFEESCAMLALCARLPIIASDAGGERSPHPTFPTGVPDPSEVCAGLALPLRIENLIRARFESERIEGWPLAVWFRFAALLSAAGRAEVARFDARSGRWRFDRAGWRPSARTNARHAASGLRLGGDVAAYLSRAVELQRVPGMPGMFGSGSPSADDLDVRRWSSGERRCAHRVVLAAGGAAPDIGLLMAARGRLLGDGAAIRGARRILTAWAAGLADPPRHLDGRALIESLAIEPGPLVGRLLAACREAEAAGEIADESSALRLARALAIAYAAEDDPAIT